MGGHDLRGCFDVWEQSLQHLGTPRARNTSEVVCPAFRSANCRVFFGVHTGYGQVSET